MIKLLRVGLQSNSFHSDLTSEQIEASLMEQEYRRWSIKIQSSKSKEHCLFYAGHKVRRPPIAQRRITDVRKETIKFWYKDKNLGGRVQVQCTLEEFIDRWAQHILQRYQHAGRTLDFSLRALLDKRLQPYLLCWGKHKGHALTLAVGRVAEGDFGGDSLIDSKRQRMTWVRRIPPKGS